jgi:hypothetical protein
MRTRFIAVYKKLASLPGGRQIHDCLQRLHVWLDSRLAGQEGSLGGLWRLFHDPDWQESTLTAANLSAVCTVLIVLIAPETGHRWLLAIGIGVFCDLVMYFFYKLKLWEKSGVSYPRSSVRYWAWIVGFFFINGAMNWLLMRKIGLDTLPARGLLTLQGAMLNPLVFLYRKRFAFADRTKTKMV